MKVDSRTNFCLDTILLILLVLTIFTITSQSIGILHLVVGGLLFLTSILHVFFHWKWIKSVYFHPSKNLAKKIRANRATVNWLAILFIICGFTGLITWLVQGNIIEPFLLSVRSLSGMHRLTGTITMLLMLVHTLQHWKWIAFTTKRYFGIRTTRRQELPQGIFPDP